MSEHRCVCYGGPRGENEFAGASFVPVCPRCGRFVRADAEVTLRGDGQPVGENATCAKCGRVEMPFEGYG